MLLYFQEISSCDVIEGSKNSSILVDNINVGLFSMRITLEKVILRVSSNTLYFQVDIYVFVFDVMFANGER